MKAKDIFAIAVRLLGLVFVYQGLIAAPGAAAIFFHSFRDGSSGWIIGPLMVAWPLLVARWLLQGAPLIMRLAYPEPGGQPAAQPGGIPAPEKAGA